MSYLRILTFDDFETSFWRISCRLSAMWHRRCPKFDAVSPKMPKNDLKLFLKLQKILGQNWIFKTLIEKNKATMWLFIIKIITYYSKQLLKLSLWHCHISVQGSKIIAGRFEEHKTLGRQTNFQKFLAKGCLRNPKSW